ncbi:HAD-IIB family hydrolase [Staphylococcus kloosii]|jgi:HAD superfamily hydrolase (TIGR01484 family)|uniref:HAD-IIB family hydrolase n=1 Tax=Staphylococcus kloosii TaxID=29384 RepID=UPI00189D9734|nr:HAD-IIB family hydrolase [Staphylococcus kloosii]MBF7025317.1 HAD-IIB family hydrolase [Staphylococcus kloosii]
MTNHLILFDFDETYFKHNSSKHDIIDMREMENLLSKISASQDVIIAILTGSSFNDVLKKMNSIGMLYKPNYIFSDLSSKMHVWTGLKYEEIDEYRENSQQKSFTKKDIDKILIKISNKYNVNFVPQRRFNEVETFYNFYFYSLGNLEKDRRILLNLIEYAHSLNYKASYNLCNPLAGDPPNAYDINFIPQKAGKLYATRFLMNKYSLPKNSVLGFGDSGNDEEFLSYLKHRFVMANSSDEELKSKFNITKQPYYKGISIHVTEFMEGKYD